MNQNQIIAFGRHVATFVAGMIDPAVTFNYVSAEQATTLKRFYQPDHPVCRRDCSGGWTDRCDHLGILYASRSASPANQIKAVAANPTVAKIEVKDPVVVGAIPSERL